jgi:PD-(D/E)XK endonuclease
MGVGGSNPLAPTKFGDGMNSKSKGDISVGAVAAQLMKKGYVVLMPLSDNQRYDFVIEKDGAFQRIQCKTGHLTRKGDVIEFWSCSQGRGPRKNYRGQAEFFGVYCPKIDSTFLVPVGHVGKVHGYLRLEKAANGQNKGVRYAEDYRV